MCNVKILVAVVFALGLSGCKRKQEPRQTEVTESPTMSGSATTGSGTGVGSGTAPAGSATDAGSGSAKGPATVAADAGAGSGSAGMARQAGNCPSTVLGATTTAAVKAKTVVVTVSSKDKDAIAAIQKRASEMLKARLDAKAGQGHDQKGTQGGKSGLCPIVIPEGAKATAKNDKTGVVVTIAPMANVEELKLEIDGRIAKAAEWVKATIKAGEQGNTGGVGGGQGKDGSNHSGKGDGKGRERKPNSESAGSAAK